MGVPEEGYTTTGSGAGGQGQKDREEEEEKMGHGIRTECLGTSGSPLHRRLHTTKENKRKMHGWV